MISRKQQPLFGREVELRWLAEGIDDVSSGRDRLPVICIHGVPGVGKSSLVRRFLQEKGTTSKPRFACFYCEQEDAGGTLENFCAGLLGTACSNVSRLGATASVLTDGLNSARRKRLVGLRRAMVRRVYRETNTGGDTDVFALHRREEIGRNLAGATTETLRVWFQSLSPPHTATDRLILVFDDYDEYPESIRSWVEHDLSIALAKSLGHIQAVYLLIGRQPLFRGAGIFSPDIFRRLEVKPLAEAEGRRWFEAAGYSGDDVALLVKAGRGLPGDIVWLLKSEGPLARARERTDAMSTISRCTSEQMRWLLALAILDAANAEAMAVLFGQEEGARAFAWLSKQHSFCSLTVNDGSQESIVAIRENFRKTLLVQATADMSSDYQELREKTLLYREVSREIPTREDRECLARLAPVVRFNQKILHQVFCADET